VGAGAFFGTALLRIAKESLGCATEPLEGETELPECEGRVLGIKPSSLLTTYTMIIGLTSAALLPLMGAIVDYTRHRLLFGQITSAVFCVSIIPLIFLNEDNFIAMAIVQVVSSFVGWAQTELSHAYLPELTNDEMLLNDYTKSYTVAFFSSSVVYLIIIIGCVTVAGYGDNDLVTSQVGMIVALVINIALLPLAWGQLFGKRDKKHELPENSKLWSAGFVQLYHTGKHIATNYRALKWFYLAIAMSDSGIQALATIAVTYMTDKLQFTARENGIAIVIILCGCIPGAMLSNFVNKKLDPIKSSILALALLIIATSMFAIFMVGPGRYVETYLISFFWGMGTGWKWTVDRLLAATIIPAGQDAELMGFFLFSGQCLSWIPPLVYTSINEAGVSQRVGVASLDSYFVLSALCYFCMGGYKRAREEVGRETVYDNSTHGTEGSKAPVDGIEGGGNVVEVQDAG
jgi:UMF1 family MFS transporter